MNLYDKITNKIFRWVIKFMLFIFLYIMYTEFIID